MSTVIYIGKVISGEYQGVHYEYTPIVVIDEKGRPSIEKIKDKNLLKGLTAGSLVNLYYDKYGKVTYLTAQKGE